MSNFRPFWKTLSSFFVWPICVSYLRNNVCKELCFSLRTQRNRQCFLSGWQLFVPESDLQITLCLLSSSLGNTVLLHTLFLEYETQIGQKKNWTMVFNRIAVHMQNFWQIWEKSKNGLKLDIRRLCIQPFNCGFIKREDSMADRLNFWMADFKLKGMFKRFYEFNTQIITGLIVDLYWNAFLISQFFIFRTVIAKCLKNVFSSAQ